MADENEMEMIVEADAAPAVSSIEEAVGAVRRLLTEFKSLEDTITSVFTQKLPQGVGQLREMLELSQQIERIPVTPGRLTEANQTGQGARLTQAHLAGILQQINADPAIQALKIDAAEVRQERARRMVYDRLAQAMPQSTPNERAWAYRQWQGSYGRPEPGLTLGQSQQRWAEEAKRFEAERDRAAIEAHDKLMRETQSRYEGYMTRRAGSLTDDAAEQRVQNLMALSRRRGLTVDENGLRSAWTNARDTHLAINGPQLIDPRLYAEAWDMNRARDAQTTWANRYQYGDALAMDRARERNLNWQSRYEYSDALAIDRRRTQQANWDMSATYRDANWENRFREAAPGRAASIEREIFKIEEQINALRARGTAEQKKGIELLDQEIVRLREEQQIYLAIPGAIERAEAARIRAQRVGRAPATEEELAAQAQDRIRRQLAMRNAQMNYQGGAPMFAVEAHRMANYAVMGAAIGAAGYTGKEVLDFDKGLQDIKADAGATDGEMTRLASNILKVGSSSNLSIKDLTEATDLLVKAGYNTQQAGAMLRPISQLATATRSTANDAADVTTEVMKTYRMASTDAPMVANALAAVATRSKVSLGEVGKAFKTAGEFAEGSGMQFNEVMAAFGAMASAGMKDGSQLGSGLKSLIEALDNPTTKLRAQLAKVGMTADEVNTQTNGLGGALQNLQDHGFTAADALTGLGQRAFGAYEALSKNLDVYNQLDTSVLNSNAAIDGSTQRMDTLQAQWQKFLNGITAVANEAGGPLLRSLNVVISALALLTSGLAKAGPALEIVGSLLGAMVASGIIVWLANLVKGFLTMTAGVEAADLALAGAAAKASLLAVAEGELSVALFEAETAVRGLTVALMATPFGWLTAAITVGSVAIAAFTANHDAAARKMQEYSSAINEATGKQKDYQNAMGEVDRYVASLVDRHDSLSKNTTLAGQAAEVAVSKFAQWGLQLDATGNTVDGLIGKLRQLRKEMGAKALASMEVADENLRKQRDTAAGQYDTGRGSNVMMMAQGTDLRGLSPYARSVVQGLQQGRGLNAENLAPVLAALRHENNPQLSDLITSLERQSGNAETLTNANATLKQHDIERRQITAQISPQLDQFTQHAQQVLQERRAALAKVQAMKPGAERNQALNALIDPNNAAYNQLTTEVTHLAGNDSDLRRAMLGADAYNELGRMTTSHEPTNAAEFKARAGMYRAQASDARRRKNMGLYNQLMAKAAADDQAADDTSKDPWGKIGEYTAGRDAARQSAGNVTHAKDHTAEDLNREADTLKKRMQHMVGVGATPEEIGAQQPELEKMMQEWRSKKTAAIQHDGGDQAKSKLDALEEEFDTLWNKVIDGNLAAKAKIISDDLKRRAQDTTDAGVVAGETGGVKNLAGSIADVKAAWGKALDAQVTYLKENYLKDNPGASDKEVMAKVRDQIDAATKSYGDATSKAVVSVINAAQDGVTKASREAAEEVHRQIGMQRAQIAAAGNIYGQQNVGETHRWALEQADKHLEIHDALASQTIAHGNVQSAQAKVDSLKGQMASDPNNKTYEADLKEAEKALLAAKSAADKADESVTKLSGKTKEYTSISQALNDAWDRFAEQNKINMPVTERLADGFTDALDQAHQGLQKFFVGMEDGTERGKRAWQDLGRSILASIEQSFAKMASDAIIKQAMKLIKSVMPGGGGGGASAAADAADTATTVASDFAMAWQGKYIRMAQGGGITGPISTRDSVPTLLAPGEEVMNQDAVSMVGKDTLDAMNAAGNHIMSRTPTLAQAMPQRDGGHVNVWVVAPEAKPQPGPRDFVQAISDDLLTNGQTKQLVRAVAMGDL